MATALVAGTVWVLVRPAVDPVAQQFPAEVTSNAETTGVAVSTTAAGPDSSTPNPAPSVEPDACGERGSLRVAVTSIMTEVLREVAAEECVDLELTEIDGTAGAALLASGKVDVWVPDGREHAMAAGEGAWAAPVVAWSPIVLAAAPTTAQQISAAGAVPWGGVLAGQGTIQGIPVAAAGNSSAIALALGGELFAQAGVATGGDQRLALAATAGALRGLTWDDPARTTLPEGKLLAVELGDLGQAQIVPTAEGVLIIEIPWIAADPADPTSIRLLAGLTGADGQRRWAERGLFVPGSTGLEIAPGLTVTPRIHADPATTPFLWVMTGEGTRPGRVLAMVDVSGSMGEAEAGGLTPLQGIKTSVPLLIGGLQGKTSVGVWLFGHQLAPPHDWIEVAPVAPLSQNLPLLQQAITLTEPQRTGTSLHRTVLDAYTTMQAGYDPTFTNILGIFTDGRNEDAPTGIDLDTLKAEISRIADPERPIMLLCFGYGEADVDALNQIVAANNGLGLVSEINQPEHILGALIEANAAALSFS